MEALCLVVSEKFLVFPIVSLLELFVAVETTILMLSAPNLKAKLHRLPFLYLQEKIFSACLSSSIYSIYVHDFGVILKQ